MNISPKLLCPACRGARMVLGQEPPSSIAGDSLFRAIGHHMFIGFQIYRVACLDCGYVGTCLSEDERAGLEKKLAKDPLG